MKSKNKISEGALDVGIQSYQTSTPTNTSTSTSTPKPTGSKKPKNQMTVSTDLMKNPTTLKKIADLKTTNPNINVSIAEEAPEAVIEPKDKATITYLSNVQDSKTGKISEPFTIADKKYQMVRGLLPSKEIVMAVFAHNDTDDNGDNIIYNLEEFENTIVKKAIDEEKAMDEEPIDEEPIDEEGVVEPDGPEMAVLNPVESKTSSIDNKGINSFEGFKHYIVNEKTGKARKFKSIEELAKANMGTDEKYMGIKEFKKYVDETLFGASKRNGTGAINEITPTGQESDEEMNAKAVKLMDMIKTKLPNIIKTIKTPVARRETIAAFAEMVGVKRADLPVLIKDLKDLSKQKITTPSVDNVDTTQPATTPAAPEAQITESRKIIKTIKVKNL